MRRPGDGRARFAAALQGLSSDEFARFVAALWQARGRRVDREGSVLTVRDGVTTQRFVVTHDPAAVGRNGTAPRDAETRVVTSRRVDSESEEGVGDADELLRAVRYAVDRERASSLLDRHLGEGASAFCSTPDQESSSADGDSRRLPLTALAVLGLVLALVGVVAGSALAPGPLGGSATSPSLFGPATTTSEPTATGTATATTTPPPPAVDYRALDCPTPPTDAHPIRLRPGVVPGASSSGLDGWRVVSTTNATTFEERQALGLPTEPLVRHTARYQSPDGATFALALDRWESTRTASDVAPTLAADSDAAIRWGAYTATVRAFDRNGTRLDPETQAGRVELLLSYVHRPSGIRLGDLCVRSLLDASR
jgi:hypothetical protein